MMPELDKAPPADLLHPTVAIVNLDHLRHNARVLKEHAGETELMAVVKADGYGHRAVPVARALCDVGIGHFAVAILPEAIALREAGISEPILVFGAPRPEQFSAYAHYGLQVNVTSPEIAGALAEMPVSSSPLRVHVKVDTGMNRLGIGMDQAAAIIDRLESLAGITVDGVWTHLATADESDPSFAAEQVERFRAILRGLRRQPRSVHVANSAGLLLVPESISFDTRVLARPGIALYGLMVDENQMQRFDLRPVMTLRSSVQHVHVVQPGETVSYGRRWTATQPTTIATIGAGYADGYPRLLSNRAEVAIRGRRLPVVGSVCMDMIMVDAGPSDGTLPPVAVGDEVVLFGEGGPSATEVARLAETIPYEIVCGVTRRVPRAYVGSGSR